MGVMRMTGGALAVAMAMAAAGCVGGGSGGSATPSSTVRSSVVTAPADLQLLCASEAATRFGAPANEVLPVSSSQTGSGVYSVSLTMGSAGSATCVVDDNGTVQSVEKA
ncbi:hypothetical protein [Acuticoccus mangrovi]|uniref:Uncharacterized protein n=1 Tax=Acuticoccus mangrovi TaxID=2796142 RepID=A0A934IKR3_9HYPH|nr:hypothetical protein [Acuticoccus mangrovi]MBJ3774113.1 hypothetical protein [Acuticoccus mangrovi]